MTSKIEEAKSTCEGLHRLVRRLNGAAVDLDKGGESAHELLALIASTTDCVNNLYTQLHSLQHLPDHQTTAVASNVTTLTPDNECSDSEIVPQRIRAVAGR